MMPLRHVLAVMVRILIYIYCEEIFEFFSHDFSIHTDQAVDSMATENRQHDDDSDVIVVTEDVDATVPSTSTPIPPPSPSVISNDVSSLLLYDTNSDASRAAEGIRKCLLFLD